MSDQSPAPKAGREPRSRHDRPCDVCRRHKHLCMIPVRGEPCVSCAARKKECTFDMPPTARKRKPKDAPKPPATATAAAADPNGGESSKGKSRDRGTAYTERQIAPERLAPAAGPSWRPPEDPLHPPTGHTSAVRMDGEHVGPIFFSSGADAYPAEGDDHEHPRSLDPGEDEEEESHFVGTRAFFGLMLAEGVDGKGPKKPNTTFERLATLAFRQVSSDPRLPAYFIKHPSLLYGRGPSTAKHAWQTVLELCARVGQNLPEKAVDKLKAITLPALPFLNAKRLDHACRAQGDGHPVPYALLAGIVAHTTSYIPELGPLHKELWSQMLLALEDEYRQPRLRVIQLALLIVTSRPSENTGQSEIGLSRAVGAAHLLGLHIDPTHWNLPRWERSVRKRMFWTLLIHDKWRALLHGRPSNLHGSDYNVPVPTIHDADAGVDMSPRDTLSFESFIATCQLTVLVDKLLRQFYSVQAVLHPATGLARIATLESIRTELDDFERSLPPGMRVWKRDAVELPATGVRSFQLSLCGIRVVTNRLIVESMTDRRGPHTAIALSNALGACEGLADLVLSLTPADRASFWMPYSSHHISNAVSLLLRIALYDRQNELHIRDAAEGCTRRLIDWLVRTCAEPTWDISRSALRRISTLLLIASRELPHLSDTYAAVAAPLNLPLHFGGASASADQIFESLSLSLGPVPADWLESDFSWLNTDFLPPVGDPSGQQQQLF